MKWNNSHKNPPEQNQKVYYFGKHIGLWVGTYKYEEQSIKHKDGSETVLCPHIFYGGGGYVDACDAPYWMPYDEKRESDGWRPIVPEEYTKNLYES